VLAVRRARRIVTALIAGGLCAAALVTACATVDAPAGRPADLDASRRDAEAASDQLAPDSAFAHCRGGGWRALSGTGILVSGDAPGTQMLAAAGGWTEGDAGLVLYQVLVTGAPKEIVGRPPVDLASDANANLATCQYCGLASTGCKAISATVAGCEGEYQAIAGEARTVSMPTTDGGAYWVEVADLVLARVVRRQGFEAAEVDRNDCIALDRLTLQGAATIITRPCPVGFELYCRVADTASQR